MNDVITLIDSPLTPYSTAEQIKAWIKDLEEMPVTKEVREETAKAEKLLNDLAND